MAGRPQARGSASLFKTQAPPLGTLCRLRRWLVLAPYVGAHAVQERPAVLNEELWGQAGAKHFDQELGESLVLLFQNLDPRLGGEL